MMIGSLPQWSGRLLDPPLDPTPDEARSALRRELLRPEYYQDNLFDRIMDWLGRRLSDAGELAVDVPPLQAFAAMLIAVALIGALGWLLTRVRRQRRTASRSRAVLTDERISAAELRARAEAALTEGRHADALVDGFRAIAVRQIERGRLEETPGATAHEVARDLAVEYPDHRQPIENRATLFDAVLYGDRPASRDQAVGMLALDDTLTTARGAALR